MKQQVLFIHGGGGFIPKDGESMLDVIEKKKVTLEDICRKPDWKTDLQEELKGDFDILAPRMPNADTPRYSEWKMWFEKILPLLDKDAVFIGHSLGAMFLAKYFSENPKWEKAKALFLIAPPFGALAVDHGWEFHSIESLPEHAAKIVIWHSKDDFVVPFSAFEEYQTTLPEAEMVALDGYGHFISTESFPELKDELKKLVE